MLRKVIALILVLAVFIGGAYYLLWADRAENDKVKALYETAEPLEREREELKKELAGLDVEYDRKLRDYSTVEILFTELHQKLLSDVYPVLKKYDVVGVLGLSFEEFPNHTGKLKAEEVKQLLDYGWGTCLIYDQGWGGFKLRYEYLCQELAKYGIPAPTAIYFPEVSDASTYDSSLDEVFLECGIRTIIRPVESGRENTVADPTAALWQIGARPWYYTAAPTDLELLGRTDGGNICFTIKITDKWRTDLLSDEMERFTAILESWETNNWLYEDDPLEDYEKVGPTPAMYVNANDVEAAREVLQETYLSSLTPEQLLLLPRFRSVNLETAVTLHETAAENRPLLERERETKRAELEKKIADLDIRISDIYESFGVIKNAEENGH